MGVKIQISLYISPSSGLFFISPDEDLLFEVETSRVNFLVSFNSDDQRNTDVATTADVTTFLNFVKIQLNFNNCKHFPLHIYTLYTYISSVYERFQMHIH